VRRVASWNLMAEALVETFKRDYVRATGVPNAVTALALVDSWMEDYNTVRLHFRLGYRSAREYILF
jgi:putative transposase